MKKQLIWTELRITLSMMLGFLIGFYCLYGLASYLAEFTPWRNSVTFAWEKQVPFLPWTAVVYLSIAVLMQLPLVIIKDKTRIWLLIKILLIQTLIGCLIFIAYPVTNDFPVRQGAGLIYQAFKLADALNLTGNNLPSLHVCFAVTIAIILANRANTGQQILYYLWATAIAASTITIHEHGNIDIASGFILALWGANKWKQSVNNNARFQSEKIK